MRGGYALAGVCASPCGGILYLQGGQGQDPDGEETRQGQDKGQGKNWKSA